MKIVFFERKPFPYQFSIEQVFAEIKKQVAVEMEVKSARMPYHSKGLLPRVKNIFWSKQHQGDINHITGDVHYVALGLEKRRTILTIHDLNFLNHPNRLKRFLLKLFWITLPLKRVSLITVISEATRQDLLKRVRFPESRIRVIYNYVNPLLKPVPYRFNKEKPTLLQIGTNENKNISRLIEAIEGLSCKLIIVGQPKEHLLKMLKFYSIAHEWRTNLSAQELINEYVKCDIVSFVSTLEGFGLPIVEAQAIGRPVLTSNCSSMPEVAGAGACLVNPYEVQDIRNGIRKIMNDDTYREQLITIGFENVKRFELESICKMYINIYKEILTKEWDI